MEKSQVQRLQEAREAILTAESILSGISELPLSASAWMVEMRRDLKRLAEECERTRQHPPRPIAGWEAAR